MKTTEKRNYKRLYYLAGLVKEQDPTIDVEKFIQGWIWQTTGERTYHKSELTGPEYQAICREIIQKYNLRDEYFITIERQRAVIKMKKKRSAVLIRLQRIGIDTTNWAAVNAYLRSPRISGKPLYELTTVELDMLIPKLESILKKQKQ